MTPITRTRCTLAAVGLLGHGAIAGHVLGVRGPNAPWLSDPFVFAGATLAAIFGAGALIRGASRSTTTVGAIVLLLVLTAGAQADIALRHTAMTGADTTLAGALLAGWIVGSLARGGAGAHETTCGVFGAALTLAAIAKLRASGLGWVDGPTHALAIYVRGVGAPAPLAALRSTLALHPTLCAVGAGATLLVESLGVLYVVPRLRRGYAWVVVGMFVSLALGFGAFQPAWVVAAIGLSAQPRR